MLIWEYIVSIKQQFRVSRLEYIMKKIVIFQDKVYCTHYDCAIKNLKMKFENRSYDKQIR